jgi:3-hydroxyacyl-CoA dehydrogenase
VAGVPFSMPENPNFIELKQRRRLHEQVLRRLEARRAATTNDAERNALLAEITNLNRHIAELDLIIEVCEEN